MVVFFQSWMLIGEFCMGYSIHLMGPAFWLGHNLELFTCAVEQQKTIITPCLDSQPLVLGNINTINVPVHLYTQTPGPINCSPTLSVLEAFLLLFPLELLQHIVTDTNQYAVYELGEGKWEMSLKELYTYLTILLAMCVKETPSLEDHWSRSVLLGLPWTLKRCHNKAGSMSTSGYTSQSFLLKPHSIRLFSTTGYPQRTSVWMKEWDHGKDIRKESRCLCEEIHGNGIKLYLLTDWALYTYDFWVYCGVQPCTAKIIADFMDTLPGMFYTNSQHISHKH